MKNFLLHITLLLCALPVAAQTEFAINQGTDVRINPGCQVIFAEGGIQNASGTFSNAGEVVVEGNILNDGTLAGGTGSGTFRVLNDIENNGQMQPGQSLFELYGDDQLLFGTQPLSFHDLTLTGGGIKFMDQHIYTAGNLLLNDRELRAAQFTVYHTNPDAASIGNVDFEGFISAEPGGGLSRVTSGRQDYFFPLGAVTPTFRYRPLRISPTGGDNTFKTRFANTNPPLFQQRGQEIYYVNPKFYHVAERTEGAAAGDLTVYYDELDDGEFQTLAHLNRDNDLWRENNGTVEGNSLGTTPELISFTTPSWGFPHTEVALAGLSKELFLPNVFSPNNDGENDIFRPRGTEPFGYKLHIYDRWGNRVFESTSLEDGWDGTFRGTKMNSGVFVYYILIAGEVSHKGNVTLLR